MGLGYLPRVTPTVETASLQLSLHDILEANLNMTDYRWDDGKKLASYEATLVPLVMALTFSFRTPDHPPWHNSWLTRKNCPRCECAYKFERRATY
jgi:hypothetical protein